MVPGDGVMGKELMKKVIFLDIDGVLNSNFWNADHQREISDGKYIDTEKVKLLSGLVKKSEASIILHSGWRFWFDADVDRALEILSGEDK